MSEDAAVKQWPTVDVFAAEMKRQLGANAHKGGWLGCEPNWLASELQMHMSRLMRAVNSCPRPPAPAEKRAAIADDAADVANFAMMIADVMGALDGEHEKEAGA